MFREKVPQYQLAAWLFVAVSAPLIQLVGKSGWLTTLVTGVALLGLCWLVTALPTSKILQKKWFCLLQLPVIALVTAEFAKWSVDAWPTGTDFPVVPLMLLTLAVFSALHGASVASRVPSVLFWFLAILYGIVLAAGSKNVKAQWLTPSWKLPEEGLLLTLLLPAVAVLLPREKGRIMHLVFPVLLLFLAAAALWTVGTISPNVATEVPWPFYESSKSLSLLGVAERFESLVSVAMTLGYFSLYSLLLSAAGSVGENLKPGWGKGALVACGIAASVLTLFVIHTAQVLLVIFTLIAWCFLPLFGGFTELWKKSKKGEKSA